MQNGYSNLAAAGRSHDLPHSLPMLVFVFSFPVRGAMTKDKELSGRKCLLAWPLGPLEKCN